MGSLPIPTPNKDVTISWLYTWSKQRDMSIHEYRVVLRTIEIISAQMKGKRLSEFMYKITPTPATYEITLPIGDAFFSDMKPQDVQRELDNLLGRTFQVLNKKERIWWACTFIEHPKVNYGEGTFSYGIYKPFAEVLLDFSSGYREFELNKALALPSTYAMRFYMLISGGGDPIYLTVDDFKEKFGIDADDYKDKNGKNRIDNLEARVIKPAQKALDESCPWTFTYSKVRANERNPKSPVVAFRFFPIEQPHFRDPELEQRSLVSKLTFSNAVGADIKQWLKKELGWSSASIKSSQQILEEAQRYIDLRTFLPEVANRWLNVRYEKPNQVGYILKAVKDEVEQRKNSSNPIAIQKSMFDIPDNDGLPY